MERKIKITLLALLALTLTERLNNPHLLNGK